MDRTHLAAAENRKQRNRDRGGRRERPKKSPLTSKPIHRLPSLEGSDVPTDVAPTTSPLALKPVGPLLLHIPSLLASKPVGPLVLERPKKSPLTPKPVHRLPSLDGSDVPADVVPTTSPLALKPVSPLLLRILSLLALNAVGPLVLERPKKSPLTSKPVHRLPSLNRSDVPADFVPTKYPLALKPAGPLLLRIPSLLALNAVGHLVLERPKKSPLASKPVHRLPSLDGSDVPADVARTTSPLALKPVGSPTPHSYSFSPCPKARLSYCRRIAC
jgi:hypothetical protein